MQCFALRQAALVVLTLTLAYAAGAPASAQDRRQNATGQFDFFVLSLSWSPSFCAASQERQERQERNQERSQDGAQRSPESRSRQQQCGDRPYAFVVHGLWPQYERGFPEFCQVPAPRLDRNIVSSMLDLMPSPRLIFHEWDRHGTCSGLQARAYFEAVRKARAVVKIPDDYLALNEALTVTPDEVEAAFVKANPGLTQAGIAIGCDNRHLREVRICLNKDLQFRDCGEIDQRSCRREKVVMPPVRAGRSERAAAKVGEAQE
jgi:ribonuclease T2